ncbi:hypothetical protein BKA62DRAFT_713789 [Auriculariales sp. MPI-PUGE-AT-0066]|nr:hypothetical protein BKA62DRAFT_713789 [Auriculariales sp. MPI-PUGE-AT-0066]
MILASRSSLSVGSSSPLLLVAALHWRAVTMNADVRLARIDTSLTLGETDKFADDVEEAHLRSTHVHTFVGQMNLRCTCLVGDGRRNW